MKNSSNQIAFNMTDRTQRARDTVTGSIYRQANQTFGKKNVCNRILPDYLQFAQIQK